MTQLYRGGQVYWWRKPKYPEKKLSISSGTFNIDIQII